MWWQFNVEPYYPSIWQVIWAENPVNHSQLWIHNEAMKTLEYELNEDKMWDEPHILDIDKWINNEY